MIEMVFAFAAFVFLVGIAVMFFMFMLDYLTERDDYRKRTGKYYFDGDDDGESR